GVLPLLLDNGKVLLRTAVGFDVYERIEAGKTVVDPAARGAFGQIAERHDIEQVGADASNHGDGSKGNLVQLTPRLVGRVAVIATADFDVGDLESFLIQHADAT